MGAGWWGDGVRNSNIPLITVYKTCSIFISWSFKLDVAKDGPHINSHLLVTWPVVWHLYLPCWEKKKWGGTSSGTGVGAMSPPLISPCRELSWVSSLVSLKSCREEWDHVWKGDWASWSRKLNNSNAYKCHYPSSISNSDSRTRLSLSFKRTGQLSNQRAESSYFPLLGFWMVSRAPNAMATGTVENWIRKRGMERDSVEMAGPKGQGSHHPESRWEAGPLLHPNVAHWARILGRCHDKYHQHWLWCCAALSLNASSDDGCVTLGRLIDLSEPMLSDCCVYYIWWWIIRSVSHILDAQQIGIIVAYLTCWFLISCSTFPLAVCNDVLYPCGRAWVKTSS